MSTDDRQDPLARVEVERRDFLKKIAIAAAFAAPTIATFSVDGLRKKAFAQAQYDAPRVIALDPLPNGRAVVTFSQPMNTAVTGGDVSRGALPCRWIRTAESLYPAGVTWSGNTRQVITYTGCFGPTTLYVDYNKPGCDTAKLVGANGVELVPYSGQINDFGIPC